MDYARNRWSSNVVPEQNKRSKKSESASEGENEKNKAVGDGGVDVGECPWAACH